MKQRIRQLHTVVTTTTFISLLLCSVAIHAVVNPSPKVSSGFGRKLTTIHQRQVSFCVPRGGGGSDGADRDNNLILRIRCLDGTIQRISVNDKSVSIRTIIAPFLKKSSTDDNNTIVVHIGSNKEDSVSDIENTIVSDLQLKSGTILTIASSSSSSPKNKIQKQKKKTPTTTKKRFDPYPDLAKNYKTAMMRAKKSKVSSGSGSFASLSSLQNAMHTMDPQPEGKLKRVYMCKNIAQRFQSSYCYDTNASRSVVQPRAALLLGSVQRERTSKRKARTSLSSTTDDTEYCQVVKIHAIYEPPLQQSTSSKKSKVKKNSSGNQYDISHVQEFPENVLRIADALGLQPIGWIFGYDGEQDKQIRHGTDALPVLARDVYTGAQLQIANMLRHHQKQKQQSSDTTRGSRFITVSMDIRTGATEVFQLSDVAVQLISEDIFVNPKIDRYVTTKHPVLVDGQETTKLDTVLCLVNTALLSHTGLHCSSSSTSKGTASTTTKKKTGDVTTKTRTALQKALQQEQQQNDIFQLLSDFGVLLYIDKHIDDDCMTELCTCIRKWSRGQRKTSTLDASIRTKLIEIFT